MSEDAEEKKKEGPAETAEETAEEKDEAREAMEAPGKEMPDLHQLTEEPASAARRSRR